MSDDFTNWQQDNNLVPSYQRFPRTDKRHNLNISAEAYEGLLKLTEVFNCPGSNRKKIDNLLEMIGLNALHVTEPKYSFKIDSVNINSNICYEDGKQDAREGREYNFQLLYPEEDRIYEEAYRRGYLQIKSTIQEKKTKLET